MIKKVRSHILSGARIVRREGVVALGRKTMRKIRARNIPQEQKQKIQFLVDYQDALKADWSKPKPPPTRIPASKKHYAFNWIMSPPGRGSGGHQNLFRFIRYLEQAGHTCRIYLYSTFDQRSVAEVKDVLKESYAKTNASIEWLKDGMPEADGIFATGWETAYPAFNSTSRAQRFYFVQDFEPYFYPTGSEYVLAENTYRFGFYGTTAGGWLAQKLRDNYGMETDHFDFGAGSDFYTHINHTRRKEIFFYARPVTTRRGFELGVMTLDLFHKKHPDYVINMAGWDVSNYDISFPYNNLRTLPLHELPALYNRCSAGLVISLTNFSLLPLELLACGTIPVINDGDNNRLVSNNPYIAYVPNNPASLAQALSDLVEQPDLPDYAQKASASVGNHSWDDAGKTFVALVEKKLRHG